MMHFSIESLARSECPFKLGFSQWISIDQEKVNAFAYLTGDLQRIHTDPEWAHADGPFSTPVIHGAFLLALVPVIVGELVVVTPCDYIVNVGIDQARFKHPAPVGSKLRGEGVLQEVAQINGGVVVTVRIRIISEVMKRLVCRADQRMVFYQ